MAIDQNDKRGLQRPGTAESDFNELQYSIEQSLRVILTSCNTVLSNISITKLRLHGSAGLTAAVQKEAARRGPRMLLL